MSSLAQSTEPLPTSKLTAPAVYQHIGRSGFGVGTLSLTPGKGITWLRTSSAKGASGQDGGELFISGEKIVAGAWVTFGKMSYLRVSYREGGEEETNDEGDDVSLRLPLPLPLPLPFHRLTRPPHTH